MSIVKISSTACRCAVLLLALPALVGCVSMYVDSNTREVDTAQFKKPNTPRPVQFFFEFQSKGVANVRATEALKVRVSDQVKASGLFGSLSDEPVAGSASLSIVVNNVPLTDDAFAKGFAAGFTFGLVGSTVSDGYVCTVRYRGDMRAAPVIKLARHAIHTTVGATSAPNNAVKAANPDEAVALMLRQIVSNVLNDLSQDSAFHSPRDMAPTAAH